MRGSADCLTVAEVPETRFADTPGGRIAYQVVGGGPIDVLVTHSPVFPIDHMWGRAQPRTLPRPALLATPGEAVLRACEGFS
jgi:hypothetical protein